MVDQISSNAVNGIIDDVFSTRFLVNYYPWLALDLGVGFLYKVPVCACTSTTNHLRMCNQ